MMKSLIKFEMRKILTKRISLISYAAILLLSFILNFSTLQNMYAFDGKSMEGSGKEAVDIDKEIASEYEGILTDEKVQEILMKFKPKQDMNGLNAKYSYLNALQSSVFYRFSDIDGNWNGLTVSDVYGNDPINIGYVNGWLSTSQNILKIMVFMAFVIILMTAPVFSGEYGGVDNIILTSRYGKTKCISAKVTAGILSSLIITFTIIALNIISAFIVYGKEGLDCSILFAPIEFSEGYIPFNITCGTLLKYQVLLAFMSSISVAGITFIFSALCRSQLAAFAISCAFYVIPIVLPIAETSSLYHILVLMPFYYAQFISLMSIEQMENGLLYAILAVPAAFIFMSAGIILSRRIFSRHQVL